MDFYQPNYLYLILLTVPILFIFFIYMRWTNKVRNKVFNDFNFCYKYLEQEENNGNLLGDKFIIGGAQLYNHVHSNYLHMVNKVYETVVNYNIVKSY